MGQSKRPEGAGFERTSPEAKPIRDNGNASGDVDFHRGVEELSPKAARSYRKRGGALYGGGGLGVLPLGMWPVTVPNSILAFLSSLGPLRAPSRLRMHIPRGKND